MFRGSDFKDISLKLSITIGASTDYSESLTMASLDRFLDKQYITFKQYLESAPESVIPFKDKLIKEEEQKMAQQQDMQNQQMQQQQGQQQQAQQMQQDQQGQAQQQQDQQVQDKTAQLNKLADFLQTLPKQVQAKIMALPQAEQEATVTKLMQADLNNAVNPPQIKGGTK